jgi:hypothetical protein
VVQVKNRRRESRRMVLRQALSGLVHVTVCHASEDFFTSLYPMDVYQPIGIIAAPNKARYIRMAVKGKGSGYVSFTSYVVN